MSVLAFHHSLFVLTLTFLRELLKKFGLSFFLLTQMESEITSTTEISEAATRGVLLKKLFLKMLQYSKENTC